METRSLLAMAGIAQCRNDLGVNMSLSVKSSPYIIPSYSLTGDLLAYLTCGLQYRYHNRGALPPSTPVQLWFGEFIHAVMEEAFLRWGTRQQAFPWPWKPTIWEIEEYVDRRRLRPKGLVPPPNLFDTTGVTQRLANRRAEASINTWGPHLFPLIDTAEVKLKGVRPLVVRGIQARADYYEVQGVVDVLTRVSLGNASPNNEIVRALESKLGKLDSFGSEFEVIVDYKGMRRPGLSQREWKQFEWQLRTYSWLRQAQPGARPVAAGIVLFLNELEPSAEDMKALKEELRNGDTDVAPAGADRVAIDQWKPKKPVPPLSAAFRAQRSIHVVSMAPNLISQGLLEFDRVVGQIETAVASEIAGSGITQAWAGTYLASGNPEPEDRVCTACDFQTFCPILARRGKRKNPDAP